MKKYGMLLLIVATNVYASTIIPATKHWSTYSDPQKLYSIPVPPGFKVSVIETPYGPKVTINESPSGTTLIVISHLAPIEAKNEQGPKGEKMWAAVGEKLTRNKRFAQLPAITIEGPTHPNVFKEWGREYHLSIKNQPIAISFTASTESQWKDHEKLFQKIESGFKAADNE